MVAWPERLIFFYRFLRMLLIYSDDRPAGRDLSCRLEVQKLRLTRRGDD
ncbi:MAG: hypothetical protein OP8BY_0219 [Candidatus Saccharicenans subterraneus]|uniref:Uncharacterized protein n=1 Tax=Candidatus Saccharicenans subterraneus TaxID=2508984 RepID=A0A3E2BLH4_9BACT|nr:MAG: hypothetical protein OP8BY_0219 [Candidatus Saccharicenans subterraneum]